jgi:glutamate synthase (NADPH/NADH) small chain
MASVCPKCRQDLVEDTICCAGLRHEWKCAQCGKRSSGFVVPYGRCFLCGGELHVVKPFEAVDPRAATVVQEALQFELDTYHFYKLGLERTQDPDQQIVFESLISMERDHIKELEEMYHVHLAPEFLDLSPDAAAFLGGWLFRDFDIDSPLTDVRTLYLMAIEMEKRTRSHFAHRAVDLPPGPEKEICRELAAEETEHIALLETELAAIGEPFEH